MTEISSSLNQVLHPSAHQICSGGQPSFLILNILLTSSKPGYTISTRLYLGFTSLVKTEEDNANTDVIVFTFILLLAPFY